jgi:c-di-GMP-binding flagellar brake protein YcgR
LDIEAFQITTPTVGQIVILIAVVVVIGLALFIASRRTTSSRSGKGRRSSTSSGWHSFYQIAKARGLGKQETELLRRLAQNCRLTKSSQVLTSMTVLDSCIQREIRRLSLNEVKGESKDDLINKYYRLRNRVARTRSASGITTTQAIPVGSQVRVMVQNDGSFNVKVNRNDDKFLGISIPILPPGKIVAWDKKRVKVSYWRENDAAYVFITKVDDVIVTEEIQTICLRHTDRVTRVQKRLYPRKSVRLPVLFSRVRVIEEGGRKKAVVDRKDTHWGTIIDISVGGSSIETTIPFNKNNYLKVEFELQEDNKVVAFGKVKRIEQHRAKKTWIMHIQFTKIDKRHKNEIFAVLYDYQTV